MIDEDKLQVYLMRSLGKRTSCRMQTQNAQAYTQTDQDLLSSPYSAIDAVSGKRRS